MKHLTHEKGDFGGAMVQANLIGKGYNVFIPVSSACPFDLVVLIGSDFKRIQVKYVTSKNQSICVSSRRAIRNGRAKFNTNIEFDILAIYCPCNNECYYVYRSEFSETITLRLIHAKNNQTKNIRLASGYLDL